MALLWLLSLLLLVTRVHISPSNLSQKISRFVEACRIDIRNPLVSFLDKKVIVKRHP